jgi:hypothetical protein
VLCGLLAIVPASLLWQCLRRLAPRMPRMENDAAAVAETPRELADTVLALEARLEHAPIALFRIENASGAGAVAPLNASARRVLAPGRASTPQAASTTGRAATGQRQLVSFDTERGAERALVAVPR